MPDLLLWMSGIGFAGMAVGWPLMKLTQKNSTEMSDWGALGAPLFFVGMFLVAPALLFLGRW